MPCPVLCRPKKDVWKTLIPQVEVMRRPRNRVVGIHMRTTDDFAWGSGGYSLAYVFQKADETVLQCARVRGAQALVVCIGLDSTHKTRAVGRLSQGTLRSSRLVVGREGGCVPESQGQEGIGHLSRTVHASRAVSKDQVAREAGTGQVGMGEGVSSSGCKGGGHTPPTPSLFQKAGDPRSLSKSREPDRDAHQGAQDLSLLPAS